MGEMLRLSQVCKLSRATKPEAWDWQSGVGLEVEDSSSNLAPLCPGCCPDGNPSAPRQADWV